jgi:hypothetical protein
VVELGDAPPRPRHLGGRRLLIEAQGLAGLAPLGRGLRRLARLQGLKLVLKQLARLLRNGTPREVVVVTMMKVMMMMVMMVMMMMVVVMVVVMMMMMMMTMMMTVVLVLVVLKGAHLQDLVLLEPLHHLLVLAIHGPVGIQQPSLLLPVCRAAPRTPHGRSQPRCLARRGRWEWGRLPDDHTHSDIGCKLGTTTAT